MNMMNACNISVEFTMMNVPSFSLLCLFYFLCFFPKFMEDGSLLESQNTSNLVFLPLEICLRKEEGWNQKKES